MVDRRYEDFLIRNLHAGKIRHSGRSFYEHLKGVHDLLRDWGNPKPVCLGGLFHSVYGTRIFQHSCLPFSQRGILIALIGPHAEHLAYVFCVTNRPKDFLESIGVAQPILYNTGTKQFMHIAPKMLTELLEIEAANLIEQGGALPTTLKRLAESDISSGAKAALGRVI